MSDIIEIRQGEELDISNLEAFLKSTISGFEKITEIVQFSGGFSNLTYLINQQYVLRKPPKGAENIKGGHNMEREYNLLKSLENANFTQIPKPLVYKNDLSILGSEFYIMQKVEGTILRTANVQEYKFSSEKWRNLSLNLCKTLAELHKIDIVESGLINLGKPEGYIQRQVKGWKERYLYSKTNEFPQFEKVIEWLENNLPKEMAPSLIHNDYKYDNVVFDLEAEKISAILDWEMTTVGDPRMDIGTCLSYWAEDTDGFFEKNFNVTWLPGNITKVEFIEEYKKINPIDLSDLLYFYVFGLFKNAVVLQQIFFRYKSGKTTDSRFKNLIYGVEMLFKKALSSIESNKI